MRRRAICCHENVRGHALVELALILPVLILIAFAGIDFARALNTYQIALSLSKEIASASYRECIVDVADYNSSQVNLSASHLKGLFDPKQCLAAVRASLATTVSNVAPNTEFSIVMFSYDSASNKAVEYVPTGYPSLKNHTTSSFVFSGTTSTDSSGTLEKALQDYEVLILAEVNVPYQAIFGVLLTSLGFHPDHIYAATVL
jgi:Flp pilus assembly protein TadG